MAERSTVVSCGDVSLKLTLTAKQLSKPFDQAVLAPFLKAYSKKTGTTVSVDKVTCVKVDDVMLGDPTIAASVVLLKGEAVDTEIFLRNMQAPKPAFEYNPFGAAKDGASARAPPPGTATKDFDEDDRSEVEKIKEARRAARAAKLVEEAEKAAAMPETPLSVGEKVVVCGLQSETGREMNGLHGVILGWVADKERWELQLDSHQPGKTINAKPANVRSLGGAPAPAPAPAAAEAAAPTDGAASAGDAAESGALLARLSAASSEAAALEAEAASVRAAFANIDFEDVEATDEAEEVARRASALSAALGRLQASLDEVDLSGLDDAARPAAREQRKAASARLETLVPTARALCAEIGEARKRQG